MVRGSAVRTARVRARRLSGAALAAVLCGAVVTTPAVGGATVRQVAAVTDPAAAIAAVPVDAPSGDDAGAAHVETRQPAPLAAAAAATAPTEGAADDLGVAAVDLTVVAREEGLAPFTLLGASWAPDVDVTAMVRVHAVGGWSVWTDLEAGDAAPDEGFDAGEAVAPRAASEPVWTGPADGYEIAAAGGSAPDLAVHLVRLDAAPAADGSLAPAAIAAASEPPLSSGPVGPPPIIGRAGWGARPPKWQPDAAAEARLAVIHHTADVDPYGYTADAVPGILRAIQAYHQDTQGWNDIGYNFVVDRFGRTWEARDGGASTAVIGSHAYGFNTASMGVAVLGNFAGMGASDVMVAALAQLIAWKLYLGGADPATPARMIVRDGDLYPAASVQPLPRIVGHGDLNSTSCPAGVRSSFDAVRAQVATRYAAMVGGSNIALAAGPTAPTGATGLTGDFNGDGRTDVLWHRSGDRTKVIWFGQSSGAFATSTLTVDAAFEPVLLDADGEGTTDVLWWSATRDGDLLWMGRRSGTPVVQPLAVKGALLPTVFDGDGDGDDDLVWYEPRTGATSVWTSPGTGAFSTRATSAPVGSRAVVIDYDGDGRQDLLWYRSAQYVHDIWHSTGSMAFTTAQAALPADQSPAVGDLDGDGLEDLVLSGTAGTKIWWQGFLAASELPAAGALVPTVADFSGGGRDDLLVSRADGYVQQWYGSPDRQLPYLDRGAPAGAVALAGDMNGDARADVLWYQPGSGATQLWTAS